MATHAADIALAGATDVATTAPTAPANDRYLFGPVMDFLCLGGSSLLLLPIVYALGDMDNYAGMAATMLLVSHVLNHPHFAASYQIFYRGYRRNAFTDALGKSMQVRYLIAGVGVPIAMGMLFTYGVVTSNTRLLGYTANLMALFVGWHYVKQGYGMLMVDAVLKRGFLNDGTKKILLINSYVTWLAAWLGFNSLARHQDLWGLTYYTFAIPAPVVTAGAAAAVVTGLAALLALAAHWRQKGSLPVNGVIAYLVSIYAWLMFVAINPIWVLIVPALHSVQYLLVVGRFQLNYESDRLKDESYKPRSLFRQHFGDRPWPHLIAFFLAAGMIGWLGFWGIPNILDALVPYDGANLTPTLFLFMAWIFINVHHYFMDNVMWRRENPDAKKYLFS